MSELQRSSCQTDPSYNNGDEPHSRPALPSRPSGSASESLLSTSITSPNAISSTLLSRKPVIPKRSSRISLDKRSYSPIQMREIQGGSLDEEVSITPKETMQKGSLESGYLPPKAFYKTHMFFSLDLGYWRMPARHGSIFAILFLCTFLPGWYSQYGFTRIIQVESIVPFQFDCAASGGWSFVGIDLVPFRKFTFGEAKAIDLVWNWVVGRGLQGILTLLAYRVFSDALLRVVELTAVPFDLYATLALPSTKIELLWQVSKNLFKRGNWRVKMIFFWLIVSTIYLVAVPGLMDAATAYESSYSTNFLWPSGQLVEVSELADWNKETSIVKITDNICLRFYSDVRIEPSRAIYSSDTFNATDFSYTLLHSGNDTTGYTRYGECSNITSISKNKWLLHITGGVALYDWQDEQVNATWNQKFKEKPLDALNLYKWSEWNFQPTSRKSFQCIVEDQQYLWGFSFEWLFLITMINSIWLWGLWILWLDCDTNSEFCRKRRRLGTWRAIADISEAMREELGPNICAYSDDELWRALKNRGNVKYYARRGTVDEPGHVGLSTRESGRFVITVTGH